MTGGTRLAVRLLVVWLLVACAVAAAACRDAAPARAGSSSPPTPIASSAPAPGREAARDSAAPAAAAGTAARRDLAADERCGGHTLSRHVGWTDAQLAQRLRAQRDIAAASTYTDRDTAETTIAAALTADADRVRRWAARQGRRPNLTVRYRAERGTLPVGRSLRRGADSPAPCFDLLVVLRWREDLDDFCVLTSYPEVRR